MLVLNNKLPSLWQINIFFMLLPFPLLSVLSSFSYLHYFIKHPFYQSVVTV